MSAGPLGLARAAARTWGARGLARRSRYELERRTGLVPRAERRWLDRLEACDLALAPLRPVVVPDLPPAPAPSEEVVLYGAVPVRASLPDAWVTDPHTGHRYGTGHWTSIGEAPDVDIKDTWEVGRLTWLGPWLQAAATSDDAAETCWATIESFARHNPPYVGPQWMNGQEAALRGIVVAAAASALRLHAATTPDRLRLAARLLAVTACRVRPTLGYALSQRNNHAISEAAFLWSAAVLVDGLPDAGGLRDEAAAALEEAIRDQVGADGSYAQHSPTYHRLALHGLLWALAVARAAGVPPPFAATSAVARSVGYLAPLVEPATGRVPNLGGNDGAHLFALTPAAIGDLRPVLAHAAAAAGLASPLGPGPWEAEARWFGLEPGPGRPVPATPGVALHVHRGPASRAVLRAGPLRHRPAHADQLHVDIWIGGLDVAADAGTYRYSGPAPWANALAEEAVHNVVRVPGEPQAERRGRFFWSRWAEAQVLARVRAGEVDATLVELVLPSGIALRRLVVRRGDAHGVYDRAGDHGALVRWNLPAGALVEAEPGHTAASGEGWRAAFTHGGVAKVLVPDEGDPRSGWRSPTYGVREPVTALELRVDGEGRAAAWFGPAGLEPAPLAPWSALDATSDAELVAALR